MAEQYIVYILIGIIVVSVILLVIVSIISKRSKKKSRKVIVLQTRSNHDVYEKIYKLANRNRVTKRYLEKIIIQIERIDLSDQWTIHRKAVKIMILTFGLSGLVTLYMLYFEFNIMVIGILVYAIFIIHTQVLKWIVRSIDDKLLLQFEKFLGHVRYHYHEYGMIDEAIYDAIEESDYEISLHGYKMYEILTDNNAEEKLESYYDSTPNKYFKTFLALCHTVQVYGDQKVAGTMLFLSNLNYLKEEINLELLRRAKTKHLFKSLTFISIGPIFFLVPIKKWALSNMSEMSVYYNGGYGFLVKIIIGVMVVICFQFISRLQDTDNEQVMFSDYIEKKLYKNKKIKRWIQRRKLNNYSTYLRQKDLLKSLGINLSVELLMIKMVIWGIIGLSISLIVVANVHHISRQMILKPYQFIEMNIEGVDYDSYIEEANFDKSVIETYTRKEVNYQLIRNDLLKMKSDLSSVEYDIAAKRILDKVKKYNHIYFKWWELLICIALSYLAYMMPYYTVIFKKKVLQLNMEDEVVQFNTIILMLMHVKRISVEDILNTMSLFSNVFKDSIEKCLNDFEFGDTEALEQLKVDEPFLPFTRIVQKLQVASNKIPIVEAFDELKSDRLYYKDRRKQSNEMIIEKKGLWGKLIAFIPFTLTISLYLLVPFLHYSIQQFIYYSDEMSRHM